MRIHLTCSQPTRSHVLAIHAAREMLRPEGHEVSVSWPEPWQEGSEQAQAGPDEAPGVRTDVLVHVCGSDEAPIPREIARTLGNCRAVVCYAPGARLSRGSDPSTGFITRVEHLSQAVIEAHARAAS